MTARERWTTGRKVFLLGALCLLAAGGGVFAAVAPGAARAAFESEAGSAERTTPGLAAPVVAPVKLVASPADGAKQVNPAAPVSLKVTNGTVERVALTSGDGAAIEGSLSPDGTGWSAAGPLQFNSSYTYSFVVTDTAGRKTDTTRTFTTVSTANEADAAVYPLDGMKVGVAQPLQITFSEPVLNKDAVEKAIKVSSTSGQVGDFHWFSDSMVRYRAGELLGCQQHGDHGHAALRRRFRQRPDRKLQQEGHGPHRRQEGGCCRRHGAHLLGERQ